MEQRTAPPEPKVVLGPDEEPVPFKGNEYVCPHCRSIIPTRKVVLMAKPPRFAHLLNDVIRCCYCKFIFSYRPESRAPRQIVGEKGRPVGAVSSA